MPRVATSEKSRLAGFCFYAVQLMSDLVRVSYDENPVKFTIIGLYFPFQMAPHCQYDTLYGEWNRPYSRQTAAFPAVSNEL